MPSRIVFAILIASVAALPANVLPVTLGLLGAHYGLGPADLGYLVAANTLAGLLTSLSAPAWIQRVDSRWLAAVLLTVMAIAIVGLGHAPGLLPLYLIQVMLGVAAVGIASLAIGMIARLENPARAYGIKITADIVLAGSFLAFLPIGRLDLASYTLLLALPASLALLLVRGLGADADVEAQSTQPISALSNAPRDAWLVLLTLVVFYVAGAGLWPFLEQLGIQAELSRGTAANLIAAGLFVGMIGSLGAVAVAGRIRGIWLQAASGLLFLVSILALGWARGLVAFAIAIFVFNAAWNFFIPFVVGLVSVRDTTRRLGALVPGTGMLGGIIGPPLAGELIAQHGFRVTTIVMMLVCGSSIAAYIWLELRPSARGRAATENPA